MCFYFFPPLQNYQEGRWRYLCFLIAKASTHLQTTAKMIKHWESREKQWWNILSRAESSSWAVGKMEEEKEWRQIKWRWIIKAAFSDTRYSLGKFWVGRPVETLQSTGIRTRVQWRTTAPQTTRGKGSAPMTFLRQNSTLKRLYSSTSHQVHPM